MGKYYVIFIKYRPESHCLLFSPHWWSVILTCRTPDFEHFKPSYTAFTMISVTKFPEITRSTPAPPKMNHDKHHNIPEGKRKRQGD